MNPSFNRSKSDGSFINTKSSSSGVDLISNQMLSLESMVQEHNYHEASIHDQCIRYFDQEARIYLMNLNRQISDYQEPMIKFREKDYKAPFKPNGIGTRNLNKIYTIFQSTPDAVLSKLSS